MAIVQHERLLPLPELENKVGFKRSKLYSLIGTGAFPPGKMIQGKRLWRESEIDAWIEQQWTQAESPDPEPSPDPPAQPEPTPPPPLPPEPSEDQALTTRQVCQRYGISRRTLWRWLRQGKLPAALHMGGEGWPRWMLSDLLDWERRKK
ncbi:helix-turn-helix domain-containing protein [Modicisalibacter sp. 'Wilcox']|uniref:helix-turn-helix transcriptional regulator n=1 Tax=Modicisalibacter sp. 'Wilcox' TaxID=2679914 RepID=UPI0013D1C017|nr:helix-turn-helix domain-containing protein [Modicisalibacter sp. 'Wilcox']